MFKERIKRLREVKGLNKRQIASILNIDESTYGKYELGKREPDFETVQKLADFFDVSVDYLLGRETASIVAEPLPEYNASLTEKDLREVKKKAEAIKNGLMASVALAFDGDPEADEETYAKVMQALEEGMKLAKKEAKEKYTPKKYRKQQG
jgi:transcriptional regulator with XRE-family HTH domain